MRKEDETPRTSSRMQIGGKHTLRALILAWTHVSSTSGNRVTTLRTSLRALILAWAHVASSSGNRATTLRTSSQAWRESFPPMTAPTSGMQYKASPFHTIWRTVVSLLCKLRELSNSSLMSSIGMTSPLPVMFHVSGIIVVAAPSSTSSTTSSAPSSSAA